MAIGDLTKPDAVRRALDEYDQLGREEFLDRHHFSDARRWYLIRNGKPYESKAIAGRAYGIQFPTRPPIRDSGTFTGGLPVVRKLRALGFEVTDRSGAPARTADLERDQIYSWAELARRYDFSPDYLAIAGGMIPRPDHDAVLLITHPGGARSFDYQDYWDGPELIYTGRGQSGDQRREGANRDVGDNARQLLVFEASDSRRLRFLGRARCVEEWTARGPDGSGRERDILRFRLRFSQRPRKGRRSEAQREPSPLRRPRPFRPDSTPPGRRSSKEPADRAETEALREKARRDHKAILATLARALEARGWKRVEEIPAAVDLWATDPAGQRVIFEAKTIGKTNELHQLRAAVGQLLEYRFHYGRPGDRLCVVTNRAVSDLRTRFLDSLGIPVIRTGASQLRATSASARQLLPALLD